MIKIEVRKKDSVVTIKNGAFTQEDLENTKVYVSSKAQKKAFKAVGFKNVSVKKFD